MRTISDVFHARRQQELGEFLVYILEDGPANGTTAVRVIAFDKGRVLRCAFLAVDAEAGNYTLTVLTDVYGSLRATEFEERGTVGGLRCVIGRYERVFLHVSGAPDAAAFQIGRSKAVYTGRLP